MPEPTVQDLIARIEAAEARAIKAEQERDAALKASGQDTIAQIESKLVPQSELHRRYEEVRKRQQWLPEARFRAQALADQRGVPVVTDDRAALRQVIREEISNLVAEEAAAAAPAKAAAKR